RRPGEDGRVGRERVAGTREVAVAERRHVEPVALHVDARAVVGGLRRDRRDRLRAPDDDRARVLVVAVEDPAELGAVEADALALALLVDPTVARGLDDDDAERDGALDGAEDGRVPLGWQRGDLLADAARLLLDLYDVAAPAARAEHVGGVVDRVGEAV